MIYCVAPVSTSISDAFAGCGICAPWALADRDKDCAPRCLRQYRICDLSSSEGWTSNAEEGSLHYPTRAMERFWDDKGVGTMVTIHWLNLHFAGPMNSNPLYGSLPGQLEQIFSIYDVTNLRGKKYHANGALPPTLWLSFNPLNHTTYQRPCCILTEDISIPPWPFGRIHNHHLTKIMTMPIAFDFSSLQNLRAQTLHRNCYKWMRLEIFKT